MARNTPIEFGFKRGGEYSYRNTERGRERGASRGCKFPKVPLPAPDKQYGNEVDVCKRKRHFLPSHQKFEGRLGLNASAWLWTFLFLKKGKKKGTFFLNVKATFV